MFLRAELSWNLNSVCSIFCEKFLRVNALSSTHPVSPGRGVVALHIWGWVSSGDSGIDHHLHTIVA